VQLLPLLTFRLLAGRKGWEQKYKNMGSETTKMEVLSC
jgi:hypothetical protein